MSTATIQARLTPAELVRRHQAAVWRYLRFLGCDPAQADDLTQETFLAVLEKPFEQRCDTATAAYLRTVARNRFLAVMRKERNGPTAADLAIAVVATAWYALIAHVVFSADPLHIDEIAQVWQARVLASGRLWVPSPAEPEFTAIMHIADLDGRRFAQFPVGGPLMLMLGTLVGAEWLVGPVFAGLAVLCWAQLLRGLVPAGVALALPVTLLARDEPNLVFIVHSGIFGYLFLGSFNDEATVWVNGQRIGSSGRQFSKPVVFDLTPALQPGENTIAIRIVRNQSLNELGVGGLFRPSFLFTGPKPEGTIGQ